MSDPTLILRRANVSRKGGSWQDDDYDVFDGDRDVGRIYLIDRQLTTIQLCKVAVTRKLYLASK